MTEQHILEAVVGLLALATTGVLFAALCVYFPNGTFKKGDSK